MENCVFCKIAAKELPAERIYEDDAVLAFKDINPLAPTHLLVIPKHHYDSLDDLPDDATLAKELLLKIKRVAEIAGVSGGYKVVTNCGEEAGQVVPHLHFHILAGKKFMP